MTPYHVNVLVEIKPTTEDKSLSTSDISVIAIKENKESQEEIDSHYSNLPDFFSTRIAGGTKKRRRRRRKGKRRGTLKRK